MDANHNGRISPRPSINSNTPVNPRVKKQVVAGFIIFRRTEEGIKFLLLYRRGNYWNFPKGHFEEGENSWDAALRETEEETGLKKNDLRVIPTFRTQIKFSFTRGRQKIYDTLILYLAETNNAHVVLSPREHSGYAWFLYPDAIKILGSKYVSTKKALKQSYDFIRRGQQQNRRPDSGQRRHPQSPSTSSS